MRLIIVGQSSTMNFVRFSTIIENLRRLYKLAKAYDLTNKVVGKLRVISKVPINERPTQTHGNYWFCVCECGGTCKVPTTYLTGNSNYTQTSCGCDRKKKAFQATSYVDVSDEYLNQYVILDLGNKTWILKPEDWGLSLTSRIYEKYDIRRTSSVAQL